MLKYVLQEMPEMQEGHKWIYPKALVYSQIGNEKIVEEFQNYGMMSRGAVSGVLQTLPDILKRFLSEGHTVKIDGLGTFSLSLEFDDEKPTEVTSAGEEKGYRHVRVSRINFKPDPDFFHTIQAETEAERDDPQVRHVEKLRTTYEERCRRTQDYLKSHSFITLTEYASLNGLSRTMASKELNRLAADPNSGIKANGVAPHKVWVKE